MMVTLSVKNLFGMIPGPSRGKYHGEKHSRLNQSIVDIYKVYDSLFEMKGVVEAVFTSSVRDRETLKWSNIPNPGFVSASPNPIELDAVVTGLTRMNPVDVGYLKLASETIKKWDKATVDKALELSTKLSYLTS